MSALDQLVMAVRHNALGPVADQRAFCKALSSCVGGRSSPALPRRAMEVLEEGFESMAALREALSV